MPTPPVAVVVTGPAGAGKTTTGRALATALSGALLDLDSVTNPMVDVLAAALGVQGYDDDRLAPLVREARYACLLGAARDCLMAGTAVVLVAPFTLERADRAAWQHLADDLRRAGGEPVLAWLRITRQALGERLTSRDVARDATKLEDIQAHLQGVDLGAPVVPHVPVDALAPVSQQVHEVLSRL